MGGGRHGRGDGGAGAVPSGASRSRARVARRSKVLTGEVGVESKLSGVAEEPCPAGAKAMRRVAAEEVLVVDPVCDMVVRLGGARGCTMGESDSQGRGWCRTRERAWQSVSCCGTVSCLGTRLNICIVAGDFFLSVDWFVWGTGPGFVNRASFESIRLETFSSSTSRRCARRRYRSVRRVTAAACGCTMDEGGSRGRGESLAEHLP